MRILACAAVLVAGLVAVADEEKLPLDKVPAKVMAAVTKRFPKAEPTEAAKETTDGKTFYEVTLKEAGKTIDVTLTPDGDITTIEKQIDLKNLPKPVTAALDAKYPGAKPKFAEEVIAVKAGKEALDYYEVLLDTADKKTLEVEVSPTGEIKKVEDKTNEKK